MYVCGPTVYDYAHLGHARCYMVYDVLVRHLRATGLEVTYVRNVTDVDDKILKRAKEQEKDPTELASYYADAFNQDMRNLGLADPDVQPRVTEYMPQIIALVEQLIASGKAYVSQGDVYFAVDAYADYGALSRVGDAQRVDGASGRLDDAHGQRKRSPRDFALWKTCDEAAYGWKSPFGYGRPGWHIECSAMSLNIFGESFDLHGGGLDLVFPHHENERAQNHAATGREVVTCWMHNGFVENRGGKMSKSLGNFFALRELLDFFTGETLRYAMLTVHYRAPFCLEQQQRDGRTVFPQLEEAARRVEYLYRTKQRVLNLPGDAAGLPDDDARAAKARDFVNQVTEALDHDLDTPRSIAELSGFLRGINERMDRSKKKKHQPSGELVAAWQAGFAAVAAELGLAGDDHDGYLQRSRTLIAKNRGLNVAQVGAWVEEREEARRTKNFSRSDELRDILAKHGVEVMDSASGSSDWRIC